MTTGVIEVVEVADGDGPEIDGAAGRVAGRRRGDRAGRPAHARPRSCGATCSALPAHKRRHVWLATLDGTPAGMAHTDQDLDGVNDATIEVYAIIDPTHRRRGVGPALVRPRLSHASWPTAAPRCSAGRSTTPGAALCRELGLTHRSDDRCSRVRVVDIDPDQQQRWIDDAPARAAGYRLVGWVGMCPDEWAEPLADALAAMVDAPLDDIDWDPQVLDRPSRCATAVRTGIARASTSSPRWRWRPTASAAGVSQLLVSRLRPSLGRQGDTGVVASHRGHGLGRWLKAENLRRALAHQPGDRGHRDLQRRVEPAHAGDQRRDGLPPAPRLRHVAGPADGRGRGGRPRPSEPVLPRLSPGPWPDSSR